MENINFDMVIIGHISKDIIVIDGKTEVCPGGSAYYAAFPAEYRYNSGPQASISG